MYADMTHWKGWPVARQVHSTSIVRCNMLRSCEGACSRCKTVQVHMHAAQNPSLPSYSADMLFCAPFSMKVEPRLAVGNAQYAAVS
jgi:hypothetical protein